MIYEENGSCHRCEFGFTLGGSQKKCIPINNDICKLKNYKDKCIAYDNTKLTKK